MPESKNTLSVVMTNFNHGRYLRQSLGAILTQSYQPLEVLVVDDGSTDDSVSIITELSRKYPFLRLIQNEKNIGVLPSITRLLTEARGTHIAFQAADDIVYPGFFEKSMRQFDAHPEVGTCSTLSAVISETSEPLRVIPGPLLGRSPVYLPPQEFVAKLESHGCWIMGNTTISNRRYLVEAGGFRGELASFCDGFLYVVLGAKHGGCFIPEILAGFRPNLNSYSASANADIERSLRMIHYTVDLFRGEFKHLFPAGFAERFRDRMLDAAGWSFLLGTAAQQRNGLEKFFVFAGWRNAAVYRVFLAFSRMQLAFWRAALFFRFRRAESWSRTFQRFETLYRS